MSGFSILSNFPSGIYFHAVVFSGLVYLSGGTGGNCSVDRRVGKPGGINLNVVSRSFSFYAKCVFPRIFLHAWQKQKNNETRVNQIKNTIHHH
jgi:hypothetical protein